MGPWRTFQLVGHQATMFLPSWTACFAGIASVQYPSRTHRAGKAALQSYECQCAMCASQHDRVPNHRPEWWRLQSGNTHITHVPLGSFNCRVEAFNVVVYQLFFLAVSLQWSDYGTWEHRCSHWWWVGVHGDIPDKRQWRCPIQKVQTCTEI